MTRAGFLSLLLPLFSSDEKRLFDLVNHARVRQGVRPLTWDRKLANLARQHSSNMARENFFSHSDPVRGDLGRRLQTAGVQYTACAENIYSQSGAGRDPLAAAVDGWMKSPGHRANLLSGKYRHSGIGVVRRNGECFVTQIFLG